ncbi:MAG: hypothetical protein GX755_06785 [Syntrophomonadaceae bacterium]|nr:hypothetical protein [Syntrophomonadaceae bacterium]
MSHKKSFLLRVNPKLYEVLERWAADEFRSVNAQIEFLLREAAQRAGRLPNMKNPRPDDEAASRTEE